MPGGQARGGKHVIDPVIYHAGFAPPNLKNTFCGRC